MALTRFHRSTVAFSVLCSVSMMGSQQRAEADEPVVDQRAVEGYQRLAAYLQSLPAFSVRAATTQDEVVGDEFKLQRNAEVVVDVARPDKMHAERTSAQGDRLWVYDGKNLGIYAKTENYYASMPAPPTLLATLDEARDEHDVEIPLVDVVYVAMGGDLVKNPEAAGVVGPERINGVTCDHYAFRAKHIDFQVWIQQGDKPLPLKMVLTTRDNPTFPQSSVVMQWNTAPKFPDGAFRFTPPKGAMPMALAPSPAQAPAGHGPKPASKPVK